MQGLTEELENVFPAMPAFDNTCPSTQCRKPYPQRKAHALERKQRTMFRGVYFQPGRLTSFKITIDSSVLSIFGHANLKSWKSSRSPAPYLRIHAVILGQSNCVIETATPSVERHRFGGSAHRF